MTESTTEKRPSAESVSSHSLQRGNNRGFLWKIAVLALSIWMLGRYGGTFFHGTLSYRSRDDSVTASETDWDNVSLTVIPCLVDETTNMTKAILDVDNPKRAPCVAPLWLSVPMCSAHGSNGLSSPIE